MVKTKDTKYRFHQENKIMEKPSDQTMLKVVTQRVTSGRLLIDAGKDEWMGFGRGLIFHVSFTKHCPIDKNFTSVCKSLLNSNLRNSTFLDLLEIFRYLNLFGTVLRQFLTLSFL